MIYEIFPFLKSFPFDEYTLSSGKDADYHEELDKDELIDFTYQTMDKDITISFFNEDMEFLDMISGNVTSLDSLRFQIDEALKSNEILTKFEGIEKTKPFLEKVKSPAVDTGSFTTVLNGLQEINEVEFSEGIVNKINKLDKKLIDFKFNVNEIKAIHSYLDFQLHHAKIMLGVIIASKIH